LIREKTLPLISLVNPLPFLLSTLPKSLELSPMRRKNLGRMLLFEMLVLISDMKELGRSVQRLKLLRKLPRLSRRGFLSSSILYIWHADVDYDGLLTSADLC
jgi:hypothetical protein